jgi:DNA polymerase I-like protein with 3'-5' exonuclease and polymerase domains
MDLENIELAVWIYEVGNEELIALFESGQSVHIFIAGLIPKLKAMMNKLGIKAFKELDDYIKLKGGNFSIIYGATENKADLTYGISGAYSIVAKRFPEVPEQSNTTMQEVMDNLERHNKPFITTLGGYPLDVNVDDLFKACNYKIQGSAGFIMTKGRRRIYDSTEYKKTKGKMRNEVHDSLVIGQPLVGTIEDHHALAKTYCDLLTNEPLLKTCRADYKIKYHPQDVKQEEDSIPF